MKVAVLTSGGDAPGMNACIVAMEKECKRNNIELYAVTGGYQGLIEDSFVNIDDINIIGIERVGGSAIMVSRSADFMIKKFFDKAVNNILARGIEYLIVLGGNGSLAGAVSLEKAGIKTVGIPASIDNDLHYDYSLGFDSAINAGVEAIDAITTTAKSMSVGVIVEMMGRQCVDISAAVAKACFADLLVEKKSSIDTMTKKLTALVKKGISAPIIIVKEYCVDGESLAKAIQVLCGKKFKFERIGYIQRGARPSAFDRAYAHTLAQCAIKCVIEGRHGVTVGYVAGDMVEMETALSTQPRSAKLAVFAN